MGERTVPDKRANFPENKIVTLKPHKPYIFIRDYYFVLEQYNRGVMLSEAKNYTKIFVFCILTLVKSKSGSSDMAERKWGIGRNRKLVPLF